ncbi:Down syndrome cell adhesion molecule homolog isoform X2 [Paramuricea clavata]|nr:Down syndrome cell adhesion molecule homolog isoform X2 [Paramuricea clavata]
MWKLQTSASSYITQIIIYLDGNQHWTISRGTQFDITGLKPGTMYTVRIQTQDGSSQTSSAEDRNFTTIKAEPVNPVAISYSSLNVTIAKPPTYFKDVMVVVQIATKNPTPVEDIKTSDLNPYQTDTQAPYITAYLKADILPLSFVIGDGKQYNFENKNYLNQPLKQNSTYIVFLRFFESQDSYYSTEWSSSVKTLLKPPGLSGPPLDVTIDSRGKNSLEVSWKAPDESLQDGELTGYQVCFYSKDTASECLMFKSAKVLSLTLNNLLPSTKYFVTVSASTKAGYGEKSSEVSKITSGDPVNPLTVSYYTLILNIPKAEDYIREVMVIVQNAKSSSTPSENLKTSDLKPYRENMNDPYITAYLKADVLPLTFVVGDGKEYNSGKENYFNQPLKLSSSYIVFLRFFESQGSYYSTAWSNNVRTLIKAPVDNSKNSGQPNEEKTRMDLIIPLAILALCFLLSLGVIIYQRRLVQNKNRQDQENRKDLPRSNKAAPRLNSYMNDAAVYETPDDVIQCIERNEAESKPEISTGQESLAYMSLKDNREPANFYQSLQPPGRSVHPHHTKRSNVQAVEYENPAFSANFSGD